MYVALGLVGWIAFVENVIAFSLLFHDTYANGCIYFRFSVSYVKFVLRETEKYRFNGTL